MSHDKSIAGCIQSTRLQEPKQTFVIARYFGREKKIHCIGFQNKHLNRDLPYRDYGP